MNIQEWIPLELTVWSLCSPRDSQETSLAPQFKSISSLALSLLYGPVLTSVHDYWKNHIFDYTDLCRQSDVCFFNALSRFVIAFLPRSKCLFNFMAAFTVCSDFGAQENKICCCFLFFPIYLPWGVVSYHVTPLSWPLTIGRQAEAHTMEGAGHENSVPERTVYRKVTTPL